MFTKLCCLILTGICFVSATSDVVLSGTVNDDSGQPIADADVTLAVKSELKDKTDKLGAFELRTAVGVAMPYNISIPASSQVTGKGNALEFSLTGTVRNGMVTIFSGNGRSVFRRELGRLEKGKHTVALQVPATGFYVMHLNIGRKTTILKLINAGNGLYIGNTTISTRSGNLAKRAEAAQAIDTLIVSKEAYDTLKLPIDTYIEEGLELVLTEVDWNKCEDLELPPISEITYSNPKHPNPFKFKFMDLPNVKTKKQWECRRQEILLMAQEYLYGHMPPKCEVQGTVNGGNITAKCTYEGKSTNVSVNASGSGDILMIDFAMGAPRPANARSAGASGATFLSAANRLYGSTDMGIVMASAWGVGRIIDALEQNPDCGISAKKVVVTGCSTCGKQSMGAGVFEPRVALCVPVESGCAGTCSWRVSSEYGHGNTNTDCQDITHLETNWTGTVTDNTWEKGNPTIDHLPFDQGELMALRAPGAFLQVDNGKESYKWLCNRGNTAAAQACRWIYKALGVEDHFGYIQPDPGHGHCSWPGSLTPDLTKFYDKFLNGKSDVDTHVFTYNPESEETDKWFEFGTGDDQWDTTLVLE